MKPNDFIKEIRESVKGSEIIYTNGSCYKFYKILKAVFPNAKAYYNSDHVITKIGVRYYDITGEVSKENHLPIDSNYSHTKIDELIFDAEKYICLMTITQAFKHLIDNWKYQDGKFINKYRSYKSKYLKSLKDKKAEKIGEGKIREMLTEAGYVIKTTVTIPTKQL